ncbi:MAG: protein kinase [Planctomycetes bacterium]|nr:protein kinase [Planctomycetota bacterium]
MSPEQIRRRPQDQRSDIYSLGCVFYELASGRLPFTGESAQDLLTKHLRAAPPSLKAANSNVSDRFAALVRRMLAKQPRERPNDMAEVLRELRFGPMFAAS